MEKHAAEIASAYAKLGTQIRFLQSVVSELSVTCEEIGNFTKEEEEEPDESEEYAEPESEDMPEEQPKLKKLKLS